MPTAVKKRSNVVAIRRKSGPSPRLAKLEARLKNVSSRASAAAKDKELGFISIGAAGALAMIEKRGVKLPTVLGLDPALLIGGIAFLGGSKMVGGKNGKRLEAAGEGWLAVAANRSILRGSVKVAGEDDEYEEEDDDDDDDDDDND